MKLELTKEWFENNLSDDTLEVGACNPSRLDAEKCPISAPPREIPLECATTDENLGREEREVQERLDIRLRVGPFRGDPR